MIEKTIVIKNKMGLHARPAAEFVAFVKNIKSNVTIIKENSEIDGKSILGILSAGISCNMEVTIRVVGDTEENDLNEIITFLENIQD